MVVMDDWINRQHRLLRRFGNESAQLPEVRVMGHAFGESLRSIPGISDAAEAEQGCSLPQQSVTAGALELVLEEAVGFFSRLQGLLEVAPAELKPGQAKQNLVATPTFSFGSFEKNLSGPIALAPSDQDIRFAPAEIEPAALERDAAEHRTRLEPNALPELPASCLNIYRVLNDSGACCFHFP
jgi:hypothetical protein